MTPGFMKLAAAILIIGAFMTARGIIPDVYTFYGKCVPLFFTFVVAGVLIGRSCYKS
jgi:hypothetical protein